MLAEDYITVASNHPCLRSHTFTMTDGNMQRWCANVVKYDIVVINY